MRDFKRIGAWGKGHQLTLDVYSVTSTFPADERFGLTSQLRRSAASIPANIAEGCGRDSEAELRRFMDIAAGSAAETEYHLLLATDLGYLPRERYEALASQAKEVKRMLYGFMRKLKAGG